MNSNRITEDYVSFETAKLLKEKGFDYQGFDYIDFEGEVIRQDRPTLQMAMKWLREEKNIFIVIEPHMYDYINEKNSSYVTSLWQGDNYYENITSKDYPTYEEAVEAALKYALENLI